MHKHANVALQGRITAALNNPNYDAAKITEYAQKRGLDLGAAIKSRNLTGEQIARLTPQGVGANALSARDNLRALGYQARQTFSGSPRQIGSNVYSALKRGMTESGGGFRAGVGTKMRYLPMGAKAGAMTSALPEIRNAFKKEDPTGKGRSQTERVSRAVGSIAGGLLGNLPASVTNRLGVAGSLIGGMGATALGSAVGTRVLGGAGKLLDKGVSKMRGVQAGDITHQNNNSPQQAVPTVNRSAGSSAV